MLVLSEGPQNLFRLSWWYRSSQGTDFDISEIAGPATLPQTNNMGVCNIRGPDTYRARIVGPILQGRPQTKTPNS